MSQDKKAPALQTVAISLVLTAALVAAAYYAWIYANIWVRQWEFTKGSLITDVRFFTGLLVVFLLLTVLDKIIALLKGIVSRD